MKKHFIATLAIVIYSATAFAVVMPGAPARNAYVFKKDFENAQKKNLAARLAAKDKKTSTAIAKINGGTIDLALLDDETNRDDKYRLLSSTGTNVAANTPNPGTGNPPVVITETPGGDGNPPPPPPPPPVDPPPPGPGCGGNCGNGNGGGGGNGTGNESGSGGNGNH